MVKSRVRPYLNKNAKILSPEAIQIIVDAESKKIPNRKKNMCRRFGIGSERYNDIVAGRIYPYSPENDLQNTLNSTSNISYDITDDSSTSENIATSSIDNSQNTQVSYDEQERNAILKKLMNDVERLPSNCSS
jgi:hypothetical protein